MSETKEVTREEVLEGLRELRVNLVRLFKANNLFGVYIATGVLDGAIDYIEARPESGEKRKAIVAAERRGRLWREVCSLAKPHQRKGERVLHALRRLL